MAKEKASLTLKELEEKTRAKAQELFEKRGKAQGHEKEDWLEAEKIIKKQYGIK